MSFRIAFFILILIPAPFIEAKSRDPKSMRSSKIPPLPPHKKESVLNHLEFRTSGVSLEFHKWPKPEEKERIIRYMKEKSLIKAREFYLAQIWSFRWEGRKTTDPMTAMLICIDFPRSQFPSVKHCVMNNPSRPKGREMVSSSYQAQKPLLWAENIPLLPPPRRPQFSQKSNQCKIVPKFYGLPGQYWAQDMIGVDLLKEILPNKKKIKI